MSFVVLLKRYICSISCFVSRQYSCYLK